ncbi:MAG TPA: nuclear transport factor 2 family protein [Thermoleophilaceae bacterium]|jgi:ketosteroid isomerase-like protein
MSDENVALARRLVEAWNARDLDALLALGHPDAEYLNAPTALEPGTRRGRSEIEAVIRTQWDMLHDAHQHIERVYERGDEVFLLCRLSHLMPDSDARIEDRVLVGVTCRDGRVARYEILAQGAANLAAALETAGLDA